MLNLAEYRKKSIGLHDYLPWACLVGPGIVLNKGPSDAKKTQQTWGFLRQCPDSVPNSCRGRECWGSESPA